MKTTKRLFSLFLLLAMVASLFSGVAYASEEFDAPDVMEPVTEEVTEDPVPEEVTEEEAPLTSGEEALVPVAEEAPAEEEAPVSDALPEEAEEATEAEEAPAEDGEQNIHYRSPEYNTTDDVSSGIARWTSPDPFRSDYALVTDSDTTWDATVQTWYVVTESTTINHTVTVKGNINLILCVGVTLTVTGTDSEAGICVSGKGNSLTIYQQPGSGTGKLEATGGANAAGIGGGNGGDGSNIIINGGTVTATGGANAAGIGGGNGGSGSNITINGGTVTATGGNNEDGNCGGAGIGGGNGGNGSSITINGGEVTATGGAEGAGIGGGYNGNGGGKDSSITINGGKVTAKGGYYGCCSGGAGIGGGSNSDGSYITINGGTVIATGCCGSAGIGGGSFSYGSNITITGGMVRAEGGGYYYSDGGTFHLGAGIGGGCGADTASYSSSICITGGTVTATGGSATDYSDVTLSANGIGVGYYGAASSSYEGYATVAQNVTVSTSLVLKAGDTYPPTTDVPNEDNDLAGSLSGKQYVTIKPMLLVAKIDSTEYATVQAAIDTVTGDTETIITMIANSTENITVAAGQNITLDLNGYVLQGTDSSHSVIVNKGTLTIKDSNTDNQTHHFSDSDTTTGLWVWDSTETAAAHTVTGGCITGGKGSYEGAAGYDCEAGGITVFSGSVTMNGGNIVGNTSPADGGGVRNFGTFTMEKGTITGNAVYVVTGDPASGGGVYNYKGTFTMNGGTIGNNTSTGNGAGVSNKSTFIMTDGSITNNDTSGTGGGVYNEATFTMTGGEISGNTAVTFAGGVDQGGTMTVGGKAVIKNNTSTSNETDNLYLEDGKYITIATTDNDAPVEGSMYIGVRLEREKGQVTTASSADYQSYFHSDNADYGVYNKTEDSNQFVYIGNAALLVEENKVYDNVTEAIKGADNYATNNTGITKMTIQMLTDSIENVSTVHLTGNCKDITLDLNGHVLKSAATGTSVITVEEGKTLTIIDSNPNATHSGEYADLPAGGVITGAMEKSIGTGKLKKTSGGTGITNSGTLNLYGGTVTDNRGVTCGGVYNTSDMTVGGTAKITGNKLSNDTVQNLYLPTDSTIAIGTGKNAPAAGMYIGVTMESSTGKFTADGTAGTADHVRYFFSDNTSYAVNYNANKYLELIDEDDIQSLGFTYAANLTLSESIAVNIYIYYGTTEVGEFTVMADGTELTGTKNAEKNCIRYTMENINAAKLGNSVHYVVTYTDGKGGAYQIKSFDYSAATYCNNMKTKYTTGTKIYDLCDAVLLYGAAAQLYTGKTNTLYTEGYEDKLESITGLSDEGSMTKDASYGVGVAMSLDSKLNMKLTLTGGAGVGSFTDTNTMVGFTVGEDGYYLNGVTIANETEKSSVTVAGIQPTQMDTTLTLYYRADGDVKNHAGSATGLVTFSANQYLKAIYDSNTETPALQNLCLALYNYGVMAKAYDAQ